MLYHLLWEGLYPITADWGLPGVLNVFQYITVRTAMASMTALFLSLLLGPWLIGKLREFEVGQRIRQEGPRSHHAKAGTPTMGGVLIVVSIVISTLLWTDLRNPFGWLLVGSTLAFGMVGFADDYLKIVRKQSLGLRARSKIGAQVLITILIGYVLLTLTARGLFSTRLSVPFFKTFTPDLVWSGLLGTPLFLGAYLPFLLFIGLVLVGSTNAVNLTDGPRRLGDRIGFDRIGRVDGPDLCHRTPRVFRVPGPAIPVSRRRTDNFLRIHGRGQHGFSLVQRPSCRCFHG